MDDEDLFHRALEESPGERSAFLDQASHYRPGVSPGVPTLEQITLMKGISMWFRLLYDSVVAPPSRTPARRRRPAAKRGGRPSGSRPRLEALEDRSVPSTLTVTSLADSGSGSGTLRAEIAAANGGDTIVFAPSLAGRAITLTSGELAINKSMDIEGPGANLLTISGGNVSRVFDITASNASVTIAGLTVANGRVYGSLGGSISQGGGIYDAGGTLTLDHSTLSGNEAHGSDGLTIMGSQAFLASSAAGGGLYVAGGMVYVNQSTFSNNRAQGGSGNRADACIQIGAGYGEQGEGGGLYVAGGTVSIDNSTFSGNGSIGGRGGSGDYCTDAPPTDPSADAPGGSGGLAAGGAVRVAAGTVVVRHSTLSGNGVNGGAGGDVGYGTVSGVNGVGTGGGISGGLQMYDTILAGNTTSDVDPDLDGSLTSLGHNLIGNSSGGSGFAATDLLNVDPRLGALQTNGGPTQTMALLAGSPAINAGDNTGAPAYDQRGRGFSRIVGGAIDIGAFEVQGSPMITMQPAAQTVPLGGTATFSAAASNSLTVQYLVSVDNGVTYTAVAGATSPTLVLGNVTAAMNGNLYEATFTNSVASSTTAPARLTVISPPTANGQTVALNMATAFTLTGSDPNTPARLLTYLVTGQPAHGTLSGTAPNLIYTPTAGYIGPDSFTFKVNNGFQDSNTATVNVNVARLPAVISGTVTAGWSKQTIALNSAGLRLMAAGRKTDLPFLNINSFTITLNRAATIAPSDVSVTGLVVANYGPAMITGGGTTYTITLARPIALADRVTITIGNSDVFTFTRRVDVLPGDVNDDGVVDVRDASLIRNQIFGIAPGTPFGDLDGVGAVDMADYNIIRRRIGTKLPPKRV